MNNSEIKVGTKVIYNGFEGVVVEVHANDMLTVRLNAGDTTAFRSEFGKYESCKVIG